MNDYETLGLMPLASKESVKRRYKELMKRVHPDKNNGKTSEEAKQIQKAYDRIMQQDTTILDDPFFALCVPRHDFLLDSHRVFEDVEERLRIMNVGANELGDRYYSKTKYSVIKDGKRYVRLMENVNGNIREYEEYHQKNKNNAGLIKE